MAKPDEAGRVIAGLLGYNPGPGIYSRLERAIEAMPENVRVQELPGLLKRYKDGVPGWELKAVDLDSVIGQRPAVPREELLQAVRERSPVYTHKEVVLGGNAPAERVLNPLRPGEDWDMPSYQDAASPIGGGVVHGDPKYADYGQGGSDYTELLITQPGAGRNEYQNHWQRASTSGDVGAEDAVAHARFDTHGDALRINELQSDLGIHNRKVREAIASHKGPPAQLPSESDSAYLDRVQEQGYVVQMSDDGEWTWVNDPNKQGIQFPLEDAWSDLLIKRLALEAARKGHRAIEVASPRAIADKVGGNIDNYEHFYGKVVPGALERLGRKMGGLVEDAPPTPVPTNRQAMDAAYYEIVNRSDVPGLDNRASAVQSRARQLMSMLGAQTHRLNAGHFNDGSEAAMKTVLHNMANDLAGIVGPERMNEMYLQANEVAAAHAARTQAINRGIEDADNVQQPVGRRYLMSDEMRRRLIQEGVGAAVATGVMSQDDLIDRLNQ